MGSKERVAIRQIATYISAIVLVLCMSTSGLAQSALNGNILVRLIHGASIDQVASEYNLVVLDNDFGRDLYEVSVLNRSEEWYIEWFLSHDRRVMYAEEEAFLTLTEVMATPFHVAFEISADSTLYSSQTAYQQIDLGTVGTVTFGPHQTPPTVAVLDTGADLTHPDLAGRLVTGYNALSPGAQPLDIPDGVTNIAAGHGTMVAGIVAVVSPNSNIMPIRVINADGVGNLMNVIKGIHYAYQNGASVINMSFETSTRSQAFRDVLRDAQDAGAVLVASAGNDGYANPTYPAAFEDVVGVGSVDTGDILSSFSNFGINSKVFAPGSDIRSTYWDGTFASWTGTSFASPFVSAEVAEIQARQPNWNPQTVKQAVFNTADSIDPLNPGFASLLGFGIIDVQAAITAVSQ